MKTIPAELPVEMQQIASDLANLESKNACLQQAYNIIAAKYQGDRLKTFTRIYQVFPRSISQVWKRDGFLHCTNFTWLLGSLLIHSGKFTLEEVRTRWTLIWYFSPHQYTQVQMEDGTWVNVDLWGHRFGIALGDYAHGMHVYTQM